MNGVSSPSYCVFSAAQVQEMIVEGLVKSGRFNGGKPLIVLSHGDGALTILLNSRPSRRKVGQ